MAMVKIWFNIVLHIRDILTLERTHFAVHVQSKKKALELLSDSLSTALIHIRTHDIFDGLIVRERLGSTAIGHGVAIPHTRLQAAEQTLGCFISLKEGIDFGAEDNINVDLIFALIVPAETDEMHLELLASLAHVFGQESIRESLRKAKSREELYERLTHA